MLTFTISPEMLQIIDSALQALPWRQANPVLYELNRQLAQARNAPQSPFNGEHPAAPPDDVADQLSELSNVMRLANE